jgi:flavin-dependent dehydrogenase
VAADQPDDRYDVAVLGGGLAGLTLGLQLKQTRPETSVLVADKRDRPAPEATFKVGESTVIGSAHYFAEVLGLKDHLEEAQYPKCGLRYFVASEDNSDIAARLEWGDAHFPSVRSYQLDRGRFENELWRRNLELGVHAFRGCRVQDVELGGEQNRVTFSRDGSDHTVDARWVVDASGRSFFLKRKLGLEKDVSHTINSSWFRLGGGLDLEEWSDDPAWLGRMSERGLRMFSTNHLLGEGYWVWLIPLASGPISIGICADPRLHPYESINTFDKALEWLKEHEPPLGEAVAKRTDQIEDFLKVEDFAYGCERVYSPDRWCLTGEAGVFPDPLYSPGSVLIGIGNTYITDLVSRDLEGDEFADRLEAYNATLLLAFETIIDTYTDLYPAFGNPQVMLAKLTWDSMFGLSMNTIRSVNSKLTDLEFTGSVVPELIRTGAVNRRMQQLFRDWHAQGRRGTRTTYLFKNEVPEVVACEEDLGKRFDDETLKNKLATNADMLDAVAVLIFHQAIQSLPGQEIGEDLAINPQAISLHPEQWEEDELVDEAGLALAAARERAPNLAAILLEQPVEAA